MRPPRTRVWLLRSTTEVSASRFVNRGGVDGRGLVHAHVVHLLLHVEPDGAALPDAWGGGADDARASLYSTAWVMELPVLPPADTGTCCEVTMGTDCETLMTAFLFSLVMMDGLESTLTLFSLARALRAAMNSLAATNMLKPGARSAPVEMMPGPGGVGVWPLVFCVLVKVNLPLRTAHSMPSLVSSFSVTSAARTSMSTWRAGPSSFLIVSSMSFHKRG